MELGGNAPFIVCSDADVDRAVDVAMVAKLRNMGEACTAANRFFVHRSVATAFTERLATRMAELTVGDGAEDGVQIGPLIDRLGLGKVQRLVTDAVDRGARVVTGGQPIDGPGYFYPPTVLADVSPESELMRAEIFGPVAPILTFDDEDEMIDAAKWGLVGYLFTQDVDRALRLSDRMDVGTVVVNTGLVSNPAHRSVASSSRGWDAKVGRVGIEEFLEYKYLAIPKS